MKAVIAILKQRVVIEIAGILALCLLIWFTGPHFAFAHKAPLEPAFNRLLAILGIVSFWTLFNLIKQARSNKKEQAFIGELVAPPADPDQAAAEAAQAKEVEDLRSKFEHALQLLKTTHAKGRRDKHYLYELPWYIIIGAPGSGKTTMLVNSGLNFPLSGKLDKNDVSGVGGTRNCDWLFADEAIFLDTAGRYTTQDSHQAVDAAAWRTFLDLIRKYRPRRPINGVLVTLSIADLLEQTDEERQRHADTIRQRISELLNTLGHQFPIYMIFSKCDLLAGFLDFFEGFNKQARAQVWGETFNADQNTKPQDLIEKFDLNFGGILKRLNLMTLSRIQEERDIPHRSLILNFPRQIALIKPQMVEFLEQTFRSNRYDRQVPLLRGIYLTSGTQEGTPIDRIMGVLAATYGLNRQQAPIYSGQGKSFFITRLLKDVIFKEAQLAGSNPKVERRLRYLQLAAYSSVFLLAFLLIVAWSISYSRNKAAMERIAKQIEQYQGEVDDNTSWQSAVRSLVTRLNILKKAHAVYERDVHWMGMGLNQGDKLQAGLDLMNSRLLIYRFLPLVKTRLEQRIYTYLNKNTDEDIAVLYELLKVYLMLGQPEERLDAVLVAKRISSDWHQSFVRESELQTLLQEYTDRLFSMPIEPIVLDTNLIEHARRELNDQPLSAQIFAHLWTEAATDHRYDIALGQILPPHSDMVFSTTDGEQLMALTIPGLFTYEGYHDFFAKKGLGYVRETVTDNWVLNNFAADQESDLPRLYDDLEKLYFNQYEKQWRGLLNNLTMQKASGISQEIQMLDILSGADTPLRPLLSVVEKNTTLSRVSEADKKDTGGDKASLADQVLAAKALPAAALKMEESFEKINYLVRSKDGVPSPLDNLLGRLNDVRDFMMQIESAADGDEKALEQALDRIQGGGSSERIKAAQMDFARQPAPFNSWFLSLTSSSLNFTLASARSELNTIWKADVLAFYKAGLQGRYPLFPDSPYDVTLDDFSRFFMPNGTFDLFFQNHLKHFIDTNPSNWQPHRIDRQSMKFSLKTLKQLQYAAKIRDSFFVLGGDLPSVKFQLKAIDMDPEIVFFGLYLEGQETIYRHDPPRWHKFVWPGPKMDTGVRLTVKTTDGQVIFEEAEGPWAWMKIMEKSAIEQLNSPDHFRLTFRAGRFKARYELRTGSVQHPFQLPELSNFRCPESF